MTQATAPAGVIEHPVEDPPTSPLPPVGRASAGRPRTTALLPGAAAALLALATAAVTLTPLPLTTTAAVLAVLAVLALAGSGVWTALGPEVGRLGLAVYGTLLGLGLAGIGVVLSGATGVFAVRWLPVAAGLLAWAPALRRAVADRRQGRRHEGRRGIGWGLWGAVAAQGVLLWALLERLGTVPADGSGWRAYYVDVPWHIAFTAEALQRPPTVYPWVPDVTLGYTWLYSAALGGWGSATPVTAADLVMRVSPALFTVLAPLCVAVTAWVVSRSRLATALAPVLLTFAQGPLFIFRDTMDITPVWLIPNRDFSHLTVLLAVGALAGLATSRSARPWTTTRGALLLTVLAFVASASKGSALPVLLGAAGAAPVLAVLTRRPVVPHLVRLGAVVVGMVVAQTAVTRSLSYLRVDPLTFLGEQVPPRVDLPLTTLAVLVLLGSLLFVLVSVLPAPRLAARAVPLVGGGLGGVAATVLFGHPGLSQLYFLHAAFPLLCIGVAVGLARSASRDGLAVLAAFALAAVAFAALFGPPAPGQLRLWWAGVLALLVGTCAVVAAPAAVRALRGGGGTWSGVLVAAVSAAFVVQNWGLPASALGASVPSSPEDPAAISDAHLAAWAALEEASDPEDLVMTNKHCQAGSVAAADCDPRWFGVSAFAERRVLVEGWSYTRLSRGIAREDVYWQPALLAANDAFLAGPDEQGCADFVARGVEWVYIDKREPWSPELSRFADPVVDGPDVAVYRLDPGCSAS